LNENALDNSSSRTWIRQFDRKITFQTENDMKIQYTFIKESYLKLRLVIPETNRLNN